MNLRFESRAPCFGASARRGENVLTPKQYESTFAFRENSKVPVVCNVLRGHPVFPPSSLFHQTLLNLLRSFVLHEKRRISWLNSVLCATGTFNLLSAFSKSPV